MSDDGALYTLAEDACVEALVRRWPAWPHVMAPALSCLHFANYQIPTLRSYASNPALHEKSCRDPRLLGGAFVDLPREAAPRATTLLDAMETERASDLAFAAALTSFYREIAETAKGDSLEAHYARLPAPLKGYVELLYDYFNRPIVRCLEGPLYRSAHFDRRSQSLRLFSLTSDDARPYFMSTPKFADEQSIDWDLPFDDERIDDLFRLDCEPRPLREIEDLLGLDDRGQCVAKRLLRPALERTDPRWRGPGLRLRYFGHACVLVETAEVSILIDPLVSVRPLDSSIERFSFDDLPDHIDYALVTHGHHDHFVIETLLRLRHRIGALIVPKSSGLFYIDISLKLLAERLGFRNVREVDCLDEIEIAGGRIVAAPFLGEHNDLASAKSAYLVQTAGRSILFAADSNCLDASIYEHFLEMAGEIDTLFIGMECVGAPLSWVYGPLLPIKMDHRHSMSRRSSGCNAAHASDLAASIRCQSVFVYAVGREPWIRHLLALEPSDNDVYMAEITRFFATLEMRGVAAERLFGKAELHL